MQGRCIVVVLNLTVLMACNEPIGYPVWLAPAAAQPVELTALECARLNGKLQAAVDAKDANTLRSILATLEASEVEGNLSNVSSTRLSRTVQQLTKHDDPAIAAAAFSLVQAWARLVLSPWKANEQEVSRLVGMAEAAAAVRLAVPLILAGATSVDIDIPTAPSSAEEVPPPPCRECRHGGATARHPMCLLGVARLALADAPAALWRSSRAAQSPRRGRGTGTRLGRSGGF